MDGDPLEKRLLFEKLVVLKAFYLFVFIRQFSERVAKHGHTLVGRTLMAAQELMEHDDAHTIWTGMWTPRIRERMEHACPWGLSSRKFKQVKSAMSVLVAGVVQLYRLATPVSRKRRREHGTDERDQQLRIDHWTARTIRDGCRREGIAEDPYRRDEREFDARRYDR